VTFSRESFYAVKAHHMLLDRQRQKRSILNWPTVYYMFCFPCANARFYPFCTGILPPSFLNKLQFLPCQLVLCLLCFCYTVKHLWPHIYICFHP
jgi:hypothetical protein